MITIKVGVAHNPPTKLTAWPCSTPPIPYKWTVYCICVIIQAASPFNLRQPFDLMAFMKQEERVTILKELKDELIEYKNEFELLKEFDSFDESFIASEPKCREVKFITSQDLSISTVLPLEHNGIRYIIYIIMHSNVFLLSQLEFSLLSCPLHRFLV